MAAKRPTILRFLKNCANLEQFGSQIESDLGGHGWMPPPPFFLLLYRWGRQKGGKEGNKYGKEERKGKEKGKKRKRREKTPY